MNAWQPNLSWITDELAVGGSFPVEQAACLSQEHRVGAVIDLRGEAKPDELFLARHGIELLHLPTSDMHGIDAADLECGVRFARDMQAEGRRLLIHCAHGIGRSATLALCVLVYRGLAPLEALKLIKAKRAIVSPTPPQFECWAEWLESHRFSSEVSWKTPSYKEFAKLAYDRHAGIVGLR